MVCCVPKRVACLLPACWFRAWDILILEQVNESVNSTAGVVQPQGMPASGGEGVCAGEAESRLYSGW